MALKENYKNLPVQLLAEDYYRVADQLHHGQMSLICRTFIEALGEMFDSEGKSNLYSWLDGEEPLILHSPKARRKDSYDSK